MPSGTGTAELGAISRLAFGALPCARINPGGRMATSGFQNQDCPLLDCLVRLCVVIVVELADGKGATGNP